MKEFKLMIAGNPGFDDAAYIDRVMVSMVDTDFAENRLSIVSGLTSGIDQIGYRFAQNNDVGTHVLYDAHLNDDSLCAFSDGLLAIWDGTQNAVKALMDKMRTQNKRVFVLSY